MTRFTDFQESLGIAPNILAARLEHFVTEGIMTATPGASAYLEYHLTDKGQDFKRVIIALTEWGDRWAAPDGPPIVYEHGECGGHITLNLECDSCAQSPPVSEVVARKTEAMARGRERRLAAANTASRF
jgi:HxlR-like helix-turn-helix